MFLLKNPFLQVIIFQTVLYDFTIIDDAVYYFYYFDLFYMT
jgi:hypothetical protein